MASNIAVYYRFDTDDVINNTMRNAITGTYDATIMPGTITTANYFIGKSALNIQESNSQFATMPASLTIPQSGFSIAFWIASNNIKTTNATIFEFANSTGAYGTGKYALSMTVNSSSQIVFTYYHNSGTPTGTLTSTISVNDNIWRHVVITFTSSNVVSLYINGKLNTRATFSNYPFSTTYAVSYIGRNTVVSTIYFTGFIDDFRIYSYAITSEADINYLLYYPNYNIYITSPSLPTLLGNTVSNFYDMNNTNASQIYSPRTILPGTILLISGKPNQNFDTGDLTASSTTYVLPSYTIFDTLYRNLYVCDQGANELKRINMYSGVVNTIYYYTNVNSVEFDISNVNYYLTGQPFIPQIDLSTNTFQRNINTNPLTNTVYGLTDNSNNIFISHATGIAKINLSGTLPAAASTVITTTVQMKQMCFKPRSQTDIYAIDVSNTFIYVINKTTNANYKITLPASLFTNNPNTDLAGIVFDSMDNLYVGGLNGNNNVYMIPYYVINAISTNTTITTSQIVLYAGTSSFGYSGDGGPCINAQFMNISNLSIDAGDNLYICDSGSYTIRKIINGGARKTNFMNMITNETSVVSKTASDLKTVYSGIYSIGGAGASASNYSNYCINNTSTIIETELQAASFNTIDNSGLLIYYKFNTMDTSGIQLSNYSSAMPIFDASMSDTTLCSSNDYLVESGGLNLSATSIGTWSRIGSVPNSSILLPNNPSGFNYHGMSFGSWNGVAVSKNGLYVAGVGDFHNFYTNYNTNYNIFSQLYTVPTVELVGGTGALGYSGDGSVVSKAQFTSGLGNFLFTPNGYYIANSETIRFVNNQSIIRTVCGTNTASTTGNFGLATVATINSTRGICRDLSNTYIYITERSGQVVRRIDKNGIIYPFCAVGTTASSTGDGGPAIQATVNNPWGVLTDTSNNVYILEDSGARIRIVDFSTNFISTLAGTGTAGFNDNVAASAAQFNRPLFGLLDLSQNMYIADFNNSRIRKITAVNGVLSSTCTVTTFCGTGTASSTGNGQLATAATISGPIGIAFTSDYSYLYICENGGFTIRAINMRTGIINRVFGTGVTGAATGNGGHPLFATLSQVFDTSMDPSNNLYFGNGDALGIVRRLTPLASFPPFVKQPYNQVWALYGLSWKYISMSGTGQYQIAYMNNFGTYLSNGYGSINSWDYIADLSGIYTNSAALSYTGQYQSVMDVYGNIYVSSAYGVNSSWKQRFVNTQNTAFTPMPAKIACSFDGKYQVATAFRHQQVTRIAGTGTSGFSGDTGLATSAQVNVDLPIVFDSSNNIIIADGMNHRVRQITTRTGIITTIAGTGASTGFTAGTANAVPTVFPFGLIMDISNNYYINLYHGVVKVTGTTLALLGGSGTLGFAGDGQVLSTTVSRFQQNKIMCCDSFNNIYLCDFGNNRIRKITATNNFLSTICGTGIASSTGDGGLATAATITNPLGICCDSFNNLYVVDTNRIRKIDALSGIITTICGTGVATSTGDGASASLATISGPVQVWCDRANNLYICEYGNSTSGNGNRVRKIRAINGELNGTCIITTYAGTGTFATSGSDGLLSQLSVRNARNGAFDNFDNFYLNDSTAGILYKATQFANVIVSSNYGQTWSDVTTNITGNIAFNNVATSQTGQYMMATSLNGRIYRSTNFGALGSWTVSNSSIDNWGSVVVSNTGQYQVAAGYDMGGFYSTDFGLNWTANGMPNGNWSSLALAESTNTLYATSKNAGASGSSIYTNRAFNLPNSGLNSEWLTIHNPILKSALWPTINGVSFSFWCKSNNNGTYARFFDFGNGERSDNIIMFVSANNLAFSVYNGGTSNDTNTNIQINDNIWRHICWTITYTTPNDTTSIYTIFINGVNVYQQFNQIFTIYPNPIVRRFFYVGRSNWAADPYFNGVIDDFRIYNRVLSDQEVFKLYSATECIHYYKFDNDNDFTNTQLANYNTLTPIYDGTQYTKDPSPPIITTATTISYGTYTRLTPNITIRGLTITQNEKRLMLAILGSQFSYSDYNINLQRWNAFTGVSSANIQWTGIKTSANGYITVLCGAINNGGVGLYVARANSLNTYTIVAIESSKVNSMYSGIELTANGNRLIVVADFVYFATWDNSLSIFTNLTVTTLATGYTLSYAATNKYNMSGGIATNADGSRIAYSNATNEIYFATWNGTTYVNPVLVAVLDPYATGMTMSYDGSLLFYSNVSDFSQKIYYSIWTGTTYSVQTELSYNLVLSLNSSPTDGLPLFTPTGTLYMALSYNMQNLYIGTNNNSAYIDGTAPRNTTGYIYILPLTYTNTSTMTKKVGTDSLVVQRQNAMVDRETYIPTYDNSTTASQPFTVGTIGASGISITSDGLRAVICGRSTGFLYVSVYTPNSNTWGSLVAQTNQAAFTAETLHRARITADGSRGIAATNITGGLVYFYTWNSSTQSYSAFTATLGGISTTQYTDCDITADGSRIFTVDASNIRHASWNGSNYGTWTNTGLTSVNTVSCSRNGTKIIYNKTTTAIFIATLTGGTYIEGTVINNSAQIVQGIKQSQSNKFYAFGSTTSLFAYWNGFDAYISPGAVAGIPASGVYSGQEITYDEKVYYVVNYAVNAGAIYKINISNNFVYIPYFTPNAQPFDTTFNSVVGVSINQDATRIVIGNYSSGKPLYSTFNKSNGQWSSLIGTLITSVGNSIINLKMTADGSRLVYASRSSSIGCYVSTWLPDINNYSNGIITLGSSTQGPNSMDMTADGSRIFIVSTNGIYYANWNGTNYSNWISLGIAGSANNTNNITCSGDGMRIVYCAQVAPIILSWALWNGYTYVIQPTRFGAQTTDIRKMQLNYDGSILFYNTLSGASTSYSFWIGSGYSNAITIPTSAIPSGIDGHGLCTSYDLKTIFAVAYSTLIHQTTTDLKAPTQVSPLTIPNTTNYITPSIYSSGTNYIFSQPFTTTTDNIGISITQNGLRAVIANYNTGLLYFSTFNGSVWSALTQTLVTSSTSLINVKITADGSRGVCIARGGTGFAYYFSWNGSNYSTLTQTLGATSTTYQTIDMTTDGSRIFTVDAAFVKYADWNGSNYSTWTNTSFTGSGIQSAAVGCSSDGNRIVYCCNTTTLNYAAWNGSAYVNISTFGSITLGLIRAIRFSSDNNYVFYSQFSASPFLFFSTWNGTGFGNTNSIPLPGITGTSDAYPLAVSYDMTTIYVGAYDATIANRIYQVPFIKQPFSLPNPMIGISMTQDGTRAVFGSYSTGLLYFSAFDGSVWSALTTTLATALTASTLISVKITAGGSRGVCIARGGTGLAYYFTWNGTNYSALTQTLGATSTSYQCIDMTSDGSRIFTVDAAFVKYANWDGSNYGTWTNTSFTGSGSSSTNTANVGCSSDGNRIVYCCNTTTLNYAAWNGSAYVNISTFGSVTLGVIRTIRFSSDNNYVFYQQNSASPFLFFSAWNGTGFGDSTSITLNGITLNPFPLAISNDMKTIYTGDNNSAVLYQVPVIKQPFSITNSIVGFSITQDGLRAVIANYNTGLLYFSTFNGSVWSALTQTLASVISSSLISVKLTADGSRGVCISRGGSGFTYFFTWNGTNYSALTQTLGATSTSYHTIDMTGDGSRIFTVDGAFVKYADWNGSNYNAWVNTTFVGSTYPITASVGCSVDGFRIVYCCNTTTLNYAAWNGASYVLQSTFGFISQGITRTIRFSYDGNYVFYLSPQTVPAPGIYYSIWNGTTYGNTSPLLTYGMASNEVYGLAISYNMATLYFGTYSASISNLIYELPITLKTIRPNTTGLTFSFWVKSIASPDYGGLISLQSIYGWILMYIIGDTVYAAINEQRQSLPANIYPTNINKNSVAVATITQYTWNHIAWTIEQKTTNYDVSGAAIWTVYLNGNSVYQNTNQIYPYPGRRTTNFVGYNGQLNIFMNGNMDDYRAFNRVLSAKEIQNIYVNSPNVTYEQSSVLPAGLQSEVGETYTFSSGDAIPRLTNITTLYRDLSSIPIQNGYYCAAGETTGTTFWQAFDQDSTTSIASQNAYGTSTGLYVTAGGNAFYTKIVNIGDISGEWSQIQIPYNLQITSYTFTPDFSRGYSYPGSWYLVGSNDGGNWYPIDYRTDISSSTTSFTPNQSYSNTYFSIFRFVWRVVGFNGSNRISINFNGINFSGNANYLNYFYNSPSVLNNAIPTLTTMTSLYKSASSPIQNGTYILSESSNYYGSIFLYSAFDNNLSTFSHTSETVFNVTTGVYTGTISTTIQGVGTVFGEWQQVQIPFVLQVTSYTITNRSGYPARFPGTWYLVGSNDGTTWDSIDYNTNYTYIGDTVTFTPNQTNKTYYSYLRFVWVVVGGTGYSSNRAAINLTAIQFSGLVSKTYVPRLQSNNFTTWRYGIDNQTRTYVMGALSNDGTILISMYTPSIVYRSIDYGITWAQYNIGSPGARQIAISANGSNAAIPVPGPNFVYRSINGGTTWAAGVTSARWQHVAMNAAGTTTIFGTNGDGNYYSTDGGQTVTAATGDLAVGNTWVAISSSGLYCLTTYNVSNPIYRSINSGVTYAATSSPSTTWQCCCIEDNGLAFAFDSAGQLYRSTDFGVNWATVSGHPVQGYSTVSMSATGQYVITSTQNNIYLSKNYGITFTICYNANAGGIGNRIVQISRDGRMASVGTYNGVFMYSRL